MCCSSPDSECPCDDAQNATASNGQRSLDTRFRVEGSLDRCTGHRVGPVWDRNGIPPGHFCPKNRGICSVNVTHLLLVYLDKGESNHADGDRGLREGGSTPGRVVKLESGSNYEADSC